MYGYFVEEGLRESQTSLYQWEEVLYSLLAVSLVVGKASKEGRGERERNIKGGGKECEKLFVPAHNVTCTGTNTQSCTQAVHACAV